MRFFVCSFSGFMLAIPIHAVSSLMLYSGAVSRAVEYNGRSGNTYFSLPHLCNLPQEHIRHGIVLKEPGSEEDEQNDTVENRNILLSPEVERETDIPDNEFYPLPRLLRGMRFSRMFRGIKFVGAEQSPGTVILALESGYLAALARDNSYREQAERCKND